MRYALLMHYREPGEGKVSEEAIAEAKEAFRAHGRALESAGCCCRPTCSSRPPRPRP
jgi:hypothetical protein